jgi:hypothetical protein
MGIMLTPIVKGRHWRVRIIIGPTDGVGYDWWGCVGRPISPQIADTTCALSLTHVREGS